MSSKKKIHAGYEFIDVVLPATRAFQVRKWAIQAMLAIEANQEPEQLAIEDNQEPEQLAIENNQEPEQLAIEDNQEPEQLAIEDNQGFPRLFGEEFTITDDEFYAKYGKVKLLPPGVQVLPGRICKVIKKSHPAVREYGVVRVVKFVPGVSSSVIAHDEKPPTYKKLRNGRQVIDIDPRCIMSFYDIHNLQVILI
jgi:hypothetical protein